MVAAAASVDSAGRAVVAGRVHAEPTHERAAESVLPADRANAQRAAQSIVYRPAR